MGSGLKIGIVIGVIFAVLILIAVVSSVSNPSKEITQIVTEKPIQEEEQELSNMSIEELEKLSVSWYYDDLLRNPEKYKGEIIFFEGKIYRVDSLGKDHYAFIVWTDTGEYGLDQLVVEWEGSRLLDGDEISGYGVFDKVIDMGSMLVENYYNPKPLVKAIQLTCYNC